MRPIKLTIKGLNSFVSEQSVDFEALTRRGLFGIFGPTGSGKTTILDGITLSLYGDISRKSTNYININSSVMNISFEFEISIDKAYRYKVIREFKRNNSGGINTNLAKLVEIKGDAETVIEEGKTQVDKRCYELIGLSLNDFTRTVVLPQGKFSDFLKLRGTERRDMLERLFGLESFGDHLSSKLGSRIKNLRTISSESDGQLKAYEDIDEKEYDSKRTELIEMKRELDSQHIAINEMQRRFDFAKRLMENISSLDRLKADKTELLLMQESINEKSFRLKKSKNASLLYLHLENYIHNKKNKRDLETEKSIKKEVLINLESDLANAEAEFKAAENKKETELTDYISLKENVTEAIKQNKIKEQLQKENDVRQMEIISEQNIIDNDMKKQNECLGLLDISAQKLSALESEFINYEVHPDIREKLKEALALQENYKFYYISAEELKNKLDMQRTKLIKAEREYDSLYTESERIETAIQSYKKAFNDNIDKLPADEDYMMNLNSELFETKNKLEYIKQLEFKINSISNKIAGLESDKQKSLSQIAVIEPKLKELKNIEEDISIEASAVKLRSHLERLGYCPVCNNTHFEDIDIDKNDIKDTKILLNTLNEVQLEYDDLLLETNRLDFEIRSYKKNLEEIKEEFDITSAAIKIKDYSKAETDFENLKKAVKDHKENQNTLKKVIEDLENKNNEIQLKLSSVKTDKLNIIGMIKENEDEECNIQEKLSLLSSSIDILKEELNTANIDDFNHKITELDASYNKMKMSIRTEKDIFQKLNAENENLKQEMSARNNNLAIKRLEYGTTEKEIRKLHESIISKASRSDNLEDYLTEINSIILSISENHRNALQKKESLNIAYIKADKEIAMIDSSLKDLIKRIESEKSILDKKLTEQGFASYEEITFYYLSPEKAQDIETEIKLYNDRLYEIDVKEKTIKEFIKDERMTEVEYLELKNDFDKQRDSFKTLEENHIKLEEQVKSIKERLAEKSEILEKRKEIDTRMALLSDLESLFRGKKFVEFAAVSQLKYVCREASKRLMEISAGSYGIETDDDGGFVIRDYKNGGATRDASTLSGGETFLASLSLALALSTHIQLKGKSSLEFFFLDEGFGTLDDDTIDTVMNSLEKIYNEKLSIGIISHVESIKSRVPVKLIVTPAGINTNGSSVKIEMT